MRRPNDRPPTAGNGEGPESIKASNLNGNSNILDHRPVLLYQPPDETAPTPIRVGDRELEMVLALSGSPKTRAELAQIRPRLGLTGTGTVTRLRHKGVHIESLWKEGADADGRSVRFVAYELKGSVLGVVRP